jgi:hypothetical protein
MEIAKYASFMTKPKLFLKSKSFAMGLSYN